MHLGLFFLPELARYLRGRRLTPLMGFSFQPKLGCFISFYRTKYLVARGTGFACGPHLQVAETVAAASWPSVHTEPFVAKSIFQVSRAPKWSHPPFHSKIFLVSALCIHNLFFTYQPSFPPFGFLSSHDALPIVLCSLPLSPHLPLLLALSPLERQLFSLRPDERLWRTIKMLFKCKGVCARVRDISCWKWAAASW